MEYEICSRDTNAPTPSSANYDRYVGIVSNHLDGYYSYFFMAKYKDFGDLCELEVLGHDGPFALYPKALASLGEMIEDVTVEWLWESEKISDSYEFKLHLPEAMRIFLEKQSTVED